MFNSAHKSRPFLSTYHPTHNSNLTNPQDELSQKTVQNRNKNNNLNLIKYADLIKNNLIHGSVNIAAIVRQPL
jgi:hypothetical protein